MSAVADTASNPDPAGTIVLDADLAGAARQAAAALKAGGLVVAPLGSSYAVLADAANADATQRIFAARNAERSAPLAVAIHNPRKMPGLAAAVPESAERLMAANWPGPMTMVVRSADGLGWNLGDTGGYLSLRMPEEPLVLLMINAVGPLAFTAAATAGSGPALTCEQARAALGDRVALYIDDGERDGKPSTIVDVSRGAVEILRSGALPDADVLAVATGEQRPWERPLPVSTPPPAAADSEIVLDDAADREIVLDDREIVLDDAPAEPSPGR